MAKIHFRPYTTKQILLFPQRIDENIAEDDPVRLVNGLIDQLDLTSFRKLYKEYGRSPFHPRMMLKAVIYGYMNNVYSCRKIEERLVRDVQVMLFRNRLEVWNPGQLPYGLTVNKLLEPHKSLPANPLIADPLFWTGYVDKVGTGTEDIVTLCKDKGLKSPEYHQEEDFRVVIWRQGGQATGQVKGQVAGQVAGQVKETIRRLVLAIGGQTLTRKEIMEILSLKGRDNFRVNYLEPAMTDGYVAKLYPESDNRPDQAYYLTEKGKELLKIIP